MRTCKLVFMVMIGLVLLEFSNGQLLYAASRIKTAHSAPVTSSPLVTHSRAHVFSAQPGMRGNASFYADAFDGRRTASGQIFRQENFTAAHRYLPLGTRVRVTNLRNRRSVDVHINDRGPWYGRRIIDLSKAAARKLGMLKSGVTEVKLEVVSRTSFGKS